MKKKLDIKAGKCVIPKIIIILSSYSCQITSEFSFLSSHQANFHFMWTIVIYFTFSGSCHEFLQGKKKVYQSGLIKQKRILLKVYRLAPRVSRRASERALEVRGNSGRLCRQSYGQGCTTEPNPGRHTAAFAGRWMSRFSPLLPKALSTAPRCCWSNLCQ